MSIKRFDANQLGTIFLSNLLEATQIPKTKRERKTAIRRCLRILAHTGLGLTLRELLSVGIASDANGNLLVIVETSDAVEEN